MYFICCREQWPSSNPLPEYEIIFSDGCIPSRLHNVSDRPANFPTLDTLPREKRGPFYSDAYDSTDDASNNLRINPVIETVVANTANMLNQQQQLPTRLAMTWEAQHPNVIKIFLI